MECQRMLCKEYSTKNDLVDKTNVIYNDDQSNE
jgi:hypothetical protein